MTASIWEVLVQYPAPLRTGTLVALGSRGGFSGARLWRLDGPQGSSCIRLWPRDASFPARLDQIHRLMLRARSAGLLFVPALWMSLEGRTWVRHQDHYWEMSQWMPGQADYHQVPTTGRLQAACAGLARLHRCWEDPRGTVGVVPGVLRRLESAHEWTERLRSGWRPCLGPEERVVLDALIERAWSGLKACLADVPHRLLPWLGRALPLQPCLCDVWHDHLLFENEQLSGLIDYGAVQEDHVAVDLARMLGSLVPEDRERWEVGLQAYRSIRPLASAEIDLAWELDWTGTVLAVGNWLRWLCLEQRRFENREDVARRIERLVRRIELSVGAQRTHGNLWLTQSLSQTTP